jgi:hypothetical protein
MTITNGLCTLAEFKAFTAVRGGGSSTDTADDTVLETLIEAVSRHIEDIETGVRFWKDGSDTVRYFQADDEDEIRVDDMSAAPTLVSVDYEGLRSYTDLASTDWEVEPVNAAAKGRPYNRICISPLSTAYFMNWRRGVKVTAKFGFPSVPMDIKEICEEIVLNLSQSRDGQSSQGNITVTASGIVIRPQDIPARAQRIFASYRSRV